jgi:hypothetical protein
LCFDCGQPRATEKADRALTRGNKSVELQHAWPKIEPPRKGGGVCKAWRMSSQIGGKGFAPVFVLVGLVEKKTEQV